MQQLHPLVAVPRFKKKKSLQVIDADARVSRLAPAFHPPLQINHRLKVAVCRLFWPLQTRRVKLQFSLLSCSQPNAFRDNRRLNGRSAALNLLGSVFLLCFFAASNAFFSHLVASPHSTDAKRLLN